MMAFSSESEPCTAFSPMLEPNCARILPSAASAGFSTSLGVPRPGGGVIRRPGVGSARGAAPKPYYPSTDPGRLGSSASPQT